MSIKTLFYLLPLYVVVEISLPDRAPSGGGQRPLKSAKRGHVDASSKRSLQCGAFLGPKISFVGPQAVPLCGVHRGSPDLLQRY